MPKVIEQIVTEYQKTQINQNKDVISKAIKDITEKSNLINDKDNRAFIFRELQKKIAKGEVLLNLSCFRPKNDEKMGYGKYPVYEDNNCNHPFSLWVFSFGDRQKTPIHDHKIDCLTSVISDKPVIEKTYKVKSHEEKTVFKDKLTKERRSKGNIKEDHLDSNFVHRIKNPCKHNAVTMHMYYMTIENEGKWNSSVNVIYQKEERFLDNITNSLKRILVRSEDRYVRKMLNDMEGIQKLGNIEVFSQGQKITLKRQVDLLERTSGQRARL